MDYFDLPEPNYSKLWAKYGHRLPAAKLLADILVEQVECSQKTIRGFNDLVNRGFNRVELMHCALEIGLRVLREGLKDTNIVEDAEIETQWRVDFIDEDFDIINAERLDVAKLLLREKLKCKRLPNGAVWSKVKE